MFTGIIESMGSVVGAAAERGGTTLSVRTPFKARMGESIAVNGACVTVSGILKEGFTCWLSPETLARTTLDRLRAGDPVHVEQALKADGRLGGHFVTGHVDGVATVVGREERGDAVLLALEAPEGCERFLTPKGSVALAGVSLTVNGVLGRRFEVSLVPFTRNLTFMGRLAIGDRVNFEADILGKQVFLAVERILGGGGEGGRGGRGGVTEDLLRKAGFLGDAGSD